METSINAVIRRFKQTGNQQDFQIIYDHVLPDFRYWYRHVQRFTNNDRPTLLCEFQYIVWKAVLCYNSDNPVPDGFVRYCRAALSKHAYTLRRIHKRTPQCHSIKQDWEVVDPRSFTDSEELEVYDLINACFGEEERMILQLKLAGESAEEIKKKAELSEFKYRQGIRNIKSCRRLERAMSRF